MSALIRLIVQPFNWHHEQTIVYKTLPSPPSRSYTSLERCELGARAFLWEFTRVTMPSGETFKGKYILRFFVFKVLPVGPTQAPFGNTSINVTVSRTRSVPLEGSSVNAAEMWTRILALRAGEGVGNAAWSMTRGTVLEMCSDFPSFPWLTAYRSFTTIIIIYWSFLITIESL